MVARAISEILYDICKFTNLTVLHDTQLLDGLPKNFEAVICMA